MDLPEISRSRRGSGYLLSSTRILVLVPEHTCSTDSYGVKEDIFQKMVRYFLDTLAKCRRHFAGYRPLYSQIGLHGRLRDHISMSIGIDNVHLVHGPNILAFIVKIVA